MSVLKGRGHNFGQFLLLCFKFVQRFIKAFLKKITSLFLEIYIAYASAKFILTSVLIIGTTITLTVNNVTFVRPACIYIIFVV